VLTVSTTGGLVARIGELLCDGTGFEVTSAIVDALPVARRGMLAELGDDDFEAGCVQALADLADVLGGLVPDHRRIVLIGTTAGLGDWDAVLAGAFAAGAVGLMRSVALEFMGQGVSINLVAVPDPGLDHAASAAGLASALLRSGGVNGQVIPCDGGENLRMSRARLRTSALPPASQRA
jgi:hypothetical protein